MKKGLAVLCLSACLALTFAGCGGNSSDINVVSREDGSGTRGAFIELFKVEQEENGEKVDKTTSAATVSNSTAVVMSTVSGDKAAIGYISLGSLDDTVKAVKIDGAEATAANVKSGTYKVSRPFNIATKDGLSDVAKDFESFILSSDGQKIVEDNGYIAATSGSAYAGSKPSGKVTVAGSSSVTPVMEKLKEAYTKVNPNAQVEVQESDSTTGMTAAADGTCDIGMASRALKDSEKAKGLTETKIALDGIAVIVNKDNTIDNLTSEQVQKIYTGEITSWNDVK
ncbi:MAG: substrate-binding domain-containing protein [Eubacteriaceae bacterium]|nr:substrate-binding domain-containing protein [Eubacteriaceae bacterium]